MYCASFLQLKTTYYSDLEGVTFDVRSLLYVQVNMECKNPSNRYIIRGFNSCQDDVIYKNSSHYNSHTICVGTLCS